MTEEEKKEVRDICREEFPKLVEDYFGRTVEQIRTYLTTQIP